MEALHPTRCRMGSAGVRPDRGAFTLMELLMVVAIIGILLTILTPTFTGVRKLARAIACGSNLHQIGTAFGMHQQKTRSTKYPLDISWPGIPGNLVNEWDVFMCPDDPEPGGHGASLEFHSQLGFNVAFESGPACKVRVGPLPPDGKLMATPAGCIDYGFEDITGGGDRDFDDCLVRIYTAEKRGEIIWTTTVYTNSIQSYGRTILTIPGSMGGPRVPPLPFPVPDGYTNYGYNSMMGNPASGATLVALDYGKANANIPGEAMAPMLTKGMRHLDNANVLFTDGSVRRMSYSQLDPTLAGNQDQWGVNTH